MKNKNANTQLLKSWSACHLGLQSVRRNLGKQAIVTDTCTTFNAGIVGRAGFTAQVGVVVAVHCRHRAAEVSAVAERTRSVVGAGRAGRLLSALGTRAAALQSLIIHRTVEVCIRLAPCRSVAVLTTCRFIHRHGLITAWKCTRLFSLKNSEDQTKALFCRKVEHLHRCKVQWNMCGIFAIV